MVKQFKNKEELDKWIEGKNEELYPWDKRSVWDIDPYPMSDEEIITALFEEGYTDLDNLLESEEEYEIAGHANVKEEH